MSHHFELPPELDWKVRAWIRQHNRGLQSNASAVEGNVPIVSLLSTHPTPQERIDRLEKKKEVLVLGTFKSFDIEFKQLRERLPPNLERLSRRFYCPMTCLSAYLPIATPIFADHSKENQKEREL